MEKYERVVRALYLILADKRMDIGVKKVIFESTLTPILLHGAETWSTTTREESRIQAAEMRVLRLMVGRCPCRCEEPVVGIFGKVADSLLARHPGVLNWWSPVSFR